MCVCDPGLSVSHTEERGVTGAEAGFIEGSCSSGYCGRDRDL